MEIAKIKLINFIPIILKYDSIYHILDDCSNSSNQGFVFERLFDIFIKLGFCDIFPKSQFINLIGNPQKGSLKVLDNINNYLNNNFVISGSSGGESDISLKNIDGSYIFISSKYNEDNVKSAKKYGIQEIIAMASGKYKDIYKKYKTFLLVDDKVKLNDKLKKAHGSKYITDYIDGILDKNDLNKYFLQFKQFMLKFNDINSIDYNKLFLSNKDILNLRFHQELITQKTSTLIQESNKSFLWGCKCRSGKTFMVGGIIIKQLNIKKKLNVLIITPAPSETIPQFTDDLFNKFSDFHEFKIHNVDNGSYLNNIILHDNNIFIISKQLLQNYINHNTNLILKNIKFDIIVFDENHFAGTTQLSKDILSSYSYKNTVKIYLTATYYKPLREWNILPECQMYWDIEDEQLCKNISNDPSNFDKLKEKHGSNYIDDTIKFYKNKGYSIDDIFSNYNKMPELHIISNMFDSQRYEIIKDKLNKSDSKLGFCFNTLFSINNSKTQFNFPIEIQTILRYISGSNKEEDGDKTIFTRINNICSLKNTRNPFTQIWFLPPDNINYISTFLLKLIKNDSVLKQYDVLCINRKNNDLPKDIKNEISLKQEEAKSKGKRGLILLAGNMLSLGITLNLCDLVVLMNDTLSSDKVLQQMYRCMTEDNDKKIGFVVDLNINRILNTCINYSIYKNDKSLKDKLHYIISNNLINIDVDIMHNKKIDTNYLVNKLMDIWKEDPINHFKILLKKLDNELIEFDNDTQKLINEKFIKLIKNEKNLDASILLNDDNQPLPSGIDKKINDDYSNNIDKKSNGDDDNKDNDDNEDDDNTTVVEKVSFTKDVLPYILPLTCILTIKNTNTDFIEMLNDIKNEPSLLDTFNEQCYVWWNRNDLIDIIKNISNKFIDKSSNTYSVSIQFKLSLQSLLDNPIELLKLISDCLKPKIIEKKDFGEVFTPMDFINNNMLKDIETFWMTKYNKNIWSNHKLTWFDPTAGMGNYPIAIYYKLFEGLKNKIPDEKLRSKHIIEKQLFMGELNKKNCFIIQQIFNINNLYKLNLYHGDTLDINIYKVFGINKFDIIIGNPPYNEKLTKAGAKPLYNKFIEYYINKCKYLSFITPSRWFAGGKGLDKFRNMMLERTDLLYIKHFDDACKIFGNLVDIKGGVNYFLIDKEYNGLCDYNGTKIKLNNFDVIVDSKYYNIISKFVDYNNKLADIYHGQGHFNIKTNDENLIDRCKNDKYIKCYVSKQKGFIKYIKKKYIKNDISTFKVITARAAHAANSSFGNMFIGHPNEVCSQSYILFEVKTLDEANSLLSYMKCKLPNFMLSLRKISQDISEATCKWIPLPPLDRLWNDEKVFEYFKLLDNDIKLINDTNILGYNNISDDTISNSSIHSNNDNDDIKSLSSINISSCSLTVNRLMELCKERNIRGYSNKKKAIIINLLKDYHNKFCTSSSYISFDEDELKQILM
jgi:hypothetical protein